MTSNLDSDPTAPDPTEADPTAELAPSEPVATEPVPATVRTRARTTGVWLNVALGVAVLVAVGGVAFAAGRLTAPAGALAANGGRQPLVFNGQAGGPGSGSNGQGGQGGRGVFAAGGATIDGTVTAVDADSMTIKTASGQEIEITLDGSTTYHRQSSATSSDVKTGGTVVVRLDLGPKDGGSTSTGPTASDVTVAP